MPTKSSNEAAQQRLQGVAELLGVSVDSLRVPPLDSGPVELLRLWASLPGKAEQDAALAFLRALSHGIPNSPAFRAAE